MSDAARAPESSTHPYDALTPDVVLDALLGVGLPCDGRLQALSSYENRVYLAGLDDGGGLVAKFYRPGRWSEAQILEEHAFAAELAEAEVPVVAPLLLQGRSLHACLGAPLPDGAASGAAAGEPLRFFFSVSPRRGGRAPELDDAEVLEWIGRFIARLHAVGARRPFAQRPALDAQRFGFEPLRWLLASGMVPLDAQSAWQGACEEALACVETRYTQVIHGLNLIRLHGDCHAGNVLWTPLDAGSAPGKTAEAQSARASLATGTAVVPTAPGPHFVDLDDACMGPAVQDLWMLLSGDRAQRSGQLSCLLDGYEQMREFDRRELALIEPLRTLRLIHYSAWLARRWADPTFPRNFPWFGSTDYWQGQARQLREQIEAMEEEPLCV
ncbi:serine/threonine protein kinase [Hylemonella gracilis str. Niagara R]|uniref:Stress response kinase A n=1 Tax=Hylemonella gracilis str. Niagara R TaxID=1458275 RepID=A0A016XLD7_9BURK|nr:serine/threonine protein kinase [Hylemonella gracilis]EYC52631.1 serine/threonine protein kinase [Hylemonella gracilis str. Niagara R]